MGTSIAEALPTSTNLGSIASHGDDAEQTALHDVGAAGGPLTLSFRDIAKLALGVAEHLRRLGCRKGERIGLIGVNGAGYVAAYFGIMQAGLVAVPINHRFTSELVRFVVEDASLRHVFAGSDYAHLLPNHVSFDTLEDIGGLPVSGVDSSADIEASPDDVAMVLYTSGSTGGPKGVILTHASQEWVLRVRSRSADFSGHNMLIAAPLCHMNALLMTKLAFFNRATVTLLPQFSEIGYLSAIETFRCTWLTSVPTMLARILAKPEMLAATDISSVRVVAMGSASPGAALFQRLKEAFPRATVVVNYGSTEAGAGVFGNHPNGLARPDLSLGCPLPGIGFRLVGPDGEDRQEGELQLKTPAVMSGYLNQPEKTFEAFTEDGFFRSGDIMRRDENGFVFFVSRKDSLFKCNGETVIPAEVERLMESHPGVRASAVVPREDEVRGHVPVAFVVPDNSRPDPESLKAFVRERAPAYMYPRQVFLVESLPLGPSGKVDRNALIAQARLP